MRASRVWARAPRLTRHPHFSRLNQGNPLRRQNPLVSRALIWRGSVEPRGERFESDSEIIGFEIESNSKLIKVSRNECLVPPLKSFAFSLEKQNKGGESGVLVWDGFIWQTSREKGNVVAGYLKRSDCCHERLPQAQFLSLGPIASLFDINRAAFRAGTAWEILFSRPTYSATIWNIVRPIRSSKIIETRRENIVSCEF